MSQRLIAETIPHPSNPNARALIVYDTDPPSVEDLMGEPISGTTITYRKSGREILGTQGVDGAELEEILKDPDSYWAPVAAYVHSGATVKICGAFRRGGPDGPEEFNDSSAGDAGYPFSCQWDAGKSGIVRGSISELLSEYGRKRWTKGAQAQAEKYLRGFVENFADILEGEVYGYVVQTRPDPTDGADPDTDPDDTWEDVDSCWGFVGLEFAKESAAEALQSVKESAPAQG